jgi:hypothetical protein
MLAGVKSRPAESAGLSVEKYSRRISPTGGGQRIKRIERDQVGRETADITICRITNVQRTRAFSKRVHFAEQGRL